jgi:hypothetical protein
MELSMSKKLIVISIALFTISAGAVGLYATDHNHHKHVDNHSGGTDKYGCHTNHKTGDYHCHEPK